ncbi:MAG: hypothetical protein JWM33_3959 [Caulobacteraceae bacterium]|nr:hypothetical protein [Caulobacteraceae bacterium]
MSANRTTIINTPATPEVVTREIYRESDSVAGWLVAGLIAVVLMVGGLFLWANRANDQAQLDAAALSARTQGMVEGSQVGMNAAGGAAADAAAKASQAAVDATVSARNAQEASQATTAPSGSDSAPAPTPVAPPPNP